MNGCRVVLPSSAIALYRIRSRPTAGGLETLPKVAILLKTTPPTVVQAALRLKLRRQRRFKRRTFCSILAAACSFHEPGLIEGGLSLAGARLFREPGFQDKN